MTKIRDFFSGATNFIGRISHIIRISALIAVMLALAFMCVIRLLQIQVVDAGKYTHHRTQTFTAEQMVPAVRGQIFDSHGRKLNTNQIVYKAIVQRAFLPFDEENDVIAGVLHILMKHDHEWLDEIPITINPNHETGLFQFKNAPDVSEDELAHFKSKLGLNYDATVENCIKALADNYRIDTDKYDEQMIRYIGGVRYEMELKDFSFKNRYVFAEDISMDVIIELKEKALLLKGVDVVEEPIRLYNDPTVMPYLRGRINAINEQQYAELKDSGYSLNDSIGFFGLEESFEPVLKGEHGIIEMTRDASWETISVKVTQEVKAGNSIKLTIDSDFQRTLDEILANHINWHNYTNGTRLRKVHTKATAGSIVVLEVKTGRILGMSNYPSYNLDDYVDLMIADAAGDSPFEYKPLLNRSTGHGYRPGSSFKTVTGTAGLIHGVVERGSAVSCGGQYRIYSDFQPYCWNRGGHGAMNSLTALLHSCNVYYYDVGRRLGIERLSGTAIDLFGVGTDLNCDIKMYPGRMTTPEIMEELMSRPLWEGDTIQAAIGQSENQLTPLHMATVAMTIANGGIRYRPYLVDSVWDYEMNTLINETQPQIIADMSEGNEAAFQAVQDGMRMLGNRDIGAGMLRGLPGLFAYKTGTPEIIKDQLYDSTVLGYYPYDDPQIAYAVVLEGGEYSSWVIRNIIDAYFYDCYEPAMNADGNVTTHWLSWSSPARTRQPKAIER
ncbi:MAG: penicillin-binding transpeptidase domain-containing protein [Oscillospiraceae bacterium]|nr:penicillin-binding transpeptidase domain-containing protein [Oscillospiraceae bacterium]